MIEIISDHKPTNADKEYKKVLENWIPIYTNDETAEGYGILFFCWLR